MVNNIYRHTTPGTGYSVSLRRVGNRVVIQVRNPDPDVLPNPLARPAPGSTGVGLSIARSVVEAAGGSLSADHDRNGDWVVTLTLRPAEAANEASARPTSA